MKRIFFIKRQKNSSARDKKPATHIFKILQEKQKTDVLCEKQCCTRIN